MTENKLICGDNLDVLKTIEKESVDLIYIDPPFFSNKTYEVIWGDEAEIRSFKDRWEGGIEHYIGWLKERVQLMYDVLKPTGSFYIHCDIHANAHIRIMLDEIFGEKNFKNEIIWSYKRYTAASNRFQKLHDSIYFYGKGDKTIFNDILIAYGEKSGKADAHYKQDDDGRWFRWQKRKNKEPYKVYMSEGRRLGDVWEIPIINASAKERLGYPTQKPLALLEQILKASTNKGDLVLDAFCGCGTAMAAAQKLKREWIGIDISPTAIKTVKKRLKKEGGLLEKDFLTVGMPTTTKELHKLEPFEFQNWVIEEMQAHHSRKKVGDMGIDGFIPKDLFRNPAGIQVKQSESVGRNVVDNFKAALDRAKYKKGYIVAFSFGSGAVEEAARLKNGKEIDIELITVEDLLTQRITIK